MQRLVNPETGEIFDVVSFRRAQARLVRRARPVWQLRKTRAQRYTWGSWALRLITQLGPVAILALVAYSILLRGR